MTEPTLRERLAQTITDAGGNPGNSLHSWRCDDKERYPEPCGCVESLVADLLEVVVDALSDPDDATVEAVAEAIADAASLVEGYMALPGHALAWQDEARAAIAALADHLLGGEGE